MSARRSISTGLVSLCVVGCVSLFASALAVAAAPTVEEESVSAVTASSGTLEASINPGGSLTMYYFQYGTSTSYGTDVPVLPGALAGSGSVGVKVSQHVQELSAGTVYHYRVVAVSEAAGHVEEVDGPDRTFTTEHNDSALGLADARQWEIVTPPDKHGALFYGLNVAWLTGAGDVWPFVAQASSDGKAIVNLASQPTEDEPPGYSTEPVVLSTRGSSDWSSQVIAPPHDEPTGPAVGRGSEYTLFSEDLSRGLLQPFGGFTPLSPEATENTPYLRSDYLNGNVSEHCQTSCYQPLVTRADTLEGVAFGGEENGGRCQKQAICGPQIIDATPDLSHVALLVGGYTGGAPQLTSTPNEAGPYEETFYEWGDGQLQPLYLLPKSEGGVGVVAAQFGLAPVDHQLSDDGSFFFSHNGHVYMHDFAKGESVRLDVAQGVTEPSEGSATFMYASSDGSRVLFTNSQQLTKAPGGGLYECRIVEVEHNISCELELTGLSGGSFVGGSEDASYLYFVGAGGKLIVDHYGGGEWSTTEGPVVPPSAFGIHRIGEVGTANEAPYRISPNGRFIAFTSNEELTGYDNRDAVSGQPDVEVYLYEASSNKLVCASCNPTGAQPVGAVPSQFQLVAGFGVGGEVWTAATLPPWTRSLLIAASSGIDNHHGALYQPRYLSDTGRLFFDSAEALVPQDVDGTWDVYEYEPAGVGGCSVSSVTFGERSGGCVGLISSGSSPEESAFLDASETGGDVFFLTSAKLVSRDYDGAYDVYDAHECTEAASCFPAEPVSLPACSNGDACKAAPSPQPTIFGSTPSATFSGTGNVVPSSGSAPVVRPKSLTRAQKLMRALKSCRKKRRRQRAVCEHVARGRYGPVGKSGGAKRKVRG